MTRTWAAIADRFGPSDRPAGSQPKVAWLLAAAPGILLAVLLTMQWLVASSIGYLSDDWAWIENGLALDAWTDAFAFERHPYRPLAWLHYWLVTRDGQPSPWVARLPSWLAHLAMVCGVLALTRELGAGRPLSLAGSLLFAAYHHTPNLAWSAAFVEPARSALGLWSLLLLVRGTRQRRLLVLLSGLVLLTAALLAKQSAITVAVAFFAWCALVGAARGLGAWRLLAAAGVLGVLVAYFAVLARAGAGPGSSAVNVSGLPASIAKAATAMLPDLLGLPVLNGLRRAPSAPAFWSGVAVLLAGGALLVLAWWRGSGWTRVLLVSIVADLAVPAVFSGFHQRHSYFAAGLVCAIVAASLQRLGPRALPIALAMAALLLLLWGSDWFTQADAYRRASRQAQSLIEQARAAAVPDGRVLVVADLPLEVSRHEIPFFNWGFSSALRLHGLSTRVELVTTRPPTGSTEQRRISAAELEMLRRSPEHRLLRYDPDLDRLVIAPD